LFLALDQDGNRALSPEELHDGIINNYDFADAMHVLDLGEDDITTMFAMMDTDKDGKVNTDEFIEQLFKMRSQDSQVLLLFIKQVVNELRKKNIDGAVNELKKTIDGFVCNFPRHEVHGQAATCGTWPDVGSTGRTQEIIAKDCQALRHSQIESEEAWPEWRQWAVLHDESAPKRMQQMANHIDITTHDLDAVNRHIEEDLAALTRNARLQADEDLCPCKWTSLAGETHGHTSPPCCDDEKHESNDLLHPKLQVRGKVRCRIHDPRQHVQSECTEETSDPTMSSSTQ